MKKLLSIICILALALSMTGTVWAEEDFSLPDAPEEDYGIAPASVSDPSTWIPYEVTGGNIYFDPETQNIVGCDSSVTEAVIPAEIDGKAVRMIVSMKQNGPYSTDSNLQKVIISDGIIGILEKAFYNCQALYEVQMPDSIIEIGSYAFSGCNSLMSVKLPSKITTLSAGLFSNCTSLESIIVPQEVIKTEEAVFKGCTLLENVILPEGLIEIGKHTFENCTSLKSIVLPNSVCSIYDKAFLNSGIETITLPENVNSLSSLPNLAFNYGVFDECKNLREINVDKNNKTLYSENGVLFYRNNGYTPCLIYYPMAKNDEKYVMPDVWVDDTRSTPLGENPYLKVIEFNGNPNYKDFSNFTNLSTIILPICTNYISAGMFKDCYNITDVYYAGCEERWNKMVAPKIGNDNLYLLAANFHFNENEHIIQGIELEVGENTSVAKFESESGKSYQYNTYYQSKPFSLMENSALVAMLDGNDLTVKVSMPGWDHIIYEFSRYNTVSTNTAEYTLEDVVPQSGETHIEVDLDILGSTAYLGDIYIDSYGNLRTKLGTGTNTYTVSGTGFPVDLPVHFGSADLDEAYGGELSDYEVEVYYISNGEKVVVGRERMSAATPHEHVFGDEWKNDAQNHWHVCKKCSQTSAPEPHTLVNGVCTACGYVQPEHVHHFACVGAEGVHWDQCDECGYTTNVRAHSIVDGRCSECGYSPAKTYDANGDGEVTLDDAIAVLKIAMNVVS